MSSFDNWLICTIIAKICKQATSARSYHLLQDYRTRTPRVQASTTIVAAGTQTSNHDKQSIENSAESIAA